MGWPTCHPGRKRPLSFWRVLPPGLGPFPSHEPDGGNEHVDHAGIVTDSGGIARVVVHRVRDRVSHGLWGGSDLLRALWRFCQRSRFGEPNRTKKAPSTPDGADEACTTTAAVCPYGLPLCIARRPHPAAWKTTNISKIVGKSIKLLPIWRRIDSNANATLHGSTTSRGLGITAAARSGNGIADPPVPTHNRQHSGPWVPTRHLPKFFTTPPAPFTGPRCV